MIQNKFITYSIESTLKEDIQNKNLRDDAIAFVKENGNSSIYANGDKYYFSKFEYNGDANTRARVVLDKNVVSTGKFTTIKITSKANIDCTVQLYFEEALVNEATTTADITTSMSIAEITQAIYDSFDGYAASDDGFTITKVSSDTLHINKGTATNDCEFYVSISDGDGIATNFVTCSNVEGYKNVLTQDMINNTNTIYEMRYVYDLDGKTITVPNYSYIDYNGGYYVNGVLNEKAPINVELGHMFYNKSLNRPTYWNGTEYLDANGNRTNDVKLSTVNNVTIEASGLSTPVLMTEMLLINTTSNGGKTLVTQKSGKYYSSFTCNSLKAKDVVTDGENRYRVGIALGMYNLTQIP